MKKRMMLLLQLWDMYLLGKHNHEGREDALGQVSQLTPEERESSQEQLTAVLNTLAVSDADGDLDA